MYYGCDWSRLVSRGEGQWGGGSEGKGKTDWLHYFLCFIVVCYCDMQIFPYTILQVKQLYGTIKNINVVFVLVHKTMSCPRNTSEITFIT